MATAQIWIARLAGKLDGKSTSRGFDEVRQAIKWAEGDGLIGFEQPVCAEVRTDAGDVWWRKPHLEPPTTLPQGGLWKRLFARGQAKSRAADRLVRREI